MARSEEQLDAAQEAALDKGACHDRGAGGVVHGLIVILVARRW